MTRCFKNHIKAQYTDDVEYNEYGATTITSTTDTSYYDQNLPVTSTNTDPEVCSRCQSKVNRPSSFNNLDYFYYFQPKRSSGNNFRGNYGNIANSPFYSNWMMGMNSNQGNSQSNRGDFISMGSGGNRNSCNTRKCTQGQRTRDRIRNQNRRRNQQGNQQRFQKNRVNNMKSGNQNSNSNSNISKNCFDWLAW